jgi:uncharacterized SAM-binding protein YcdF (DUF218 family)
MKKRTRQFGIFLILISLAGLAYAHIHFCYNTFYKPAHCLSAAAEARPLDAIIVPGIPCDGGKWGIVMKLRVHWSVFLYFTGITKNIIYSGSAVYTPYNEAKIMALYAEKMGVPKENIFTETKAEHSTENLYYSWRLAKEQGFEKLAFATDPFQSLKVEPYAEKFKINVTMLPMVISIMEHIPMQDYQIESWKAYTLNFVSINERETKEEQEFYSKGGRIMQLAN